MPAESPPRDEPGSDGTGRTPPEWVDRAEYPFESHHVDLDVGRMHYVDEGEGRPLVLLHGNGTWSFLYRHFIQNLADDYRCIAPDLFGFGLSDKPRDWSYRVADHASVVEQFLEGLDLSDVTLFIHDWGGPIGMHYATRHPEDVDSFVVMNTVMWPMRDALNVQAFSRAMHTPVARILNRRYNVPAEWLMPLAFGDRTRWTPTLQRHYREPLAEPDDRRSALIMTRELLDATPFLSELWERREAVAGKPALLCWGMRGPLFRTQALKRWQALFPEARTVEYPTAGHFVQEEQGEEMVPEVRQLLGERAGND